MNSPRSIALAVTAALAATLGGTPAWAVDDEPAIIAEVEALDQATLDQAETWFFQALGHYRQGRYEAAAIDFQKAYVLTAHRDLLFNVARSRENIGDTTGAVEWYRAYLATQPADQTAIIHRIRQLGGDPTPAPMKLDEISRAVDVDSPLVEGGDSPVAPWVALGVGVAVAGAGVYFGLDALDAAAQARAADTADEARPLKTRAEQSALFADLAFGAAAVAVGAAIVLWAIDGDDAETAGRLDLGLAPGGGYLGYGVAF